MASCWFATGLRSILRGDPNVIMVGEIRDLETVEIAIRAALTGHLVFSTLHTNDALSAITRLVDMGVEPYLIASSVRAVIAQRLVRRLCLDCRQPADDHFVPSPQGCESCRFTGYNGRLALYELLTVSEALAERITHQAELSDIKALAKQEGYLPMRVYGETKVAEGWTSMAEVLAVTA